MRYIAKEAKRQVQAQARDKMGPWLSEHGRDILVIAGVCLFLLLDGLIVKAVSPIPVETASARGIDYAVEAEPEGAWEELKHVKGSFYTSYSGPEQGAEPADAVSYTYRDADGDELFRMAELGHDGLYAFTVRDKTTVYKLFSLPRGAVPHETDGL